MSKMTAAAIATKPEENTDENTLMFVTMRIEKQLFGIAVNNVRDVLRHQKVTPIPLAPPEVAGSLNLRGRIVTVIDMRKRLNLPESQTQTSSTFVVIELKNELYSLMIDGVSEVLTIAASQIEKAPANLGTSWKDMATGIHKLPDELLVLVDIQELFKI